MSIGDAEFVLERAQKQAEKAEKKAREMQPRCSRDIGEVSAQVAPHPPLPCVELRYGGDAAETQPR